MRPAPDKSTPDGKRLAFWGRDSKTSYDLWTVPIESDSKGLRAGKPEVFLQTPADERHLSFSPDGRWLACSPMSRGPTKFFSNSGGAYPMWSRNGRELFFDTLDNHIMVATYTVKGDSFVADKTASVVRKADRWQCQQQ
jgi:Tol biopolymer transport system component